jgi:hypothetical protein
MDKVNIEFDKNYGWYANTPFGICWQLFSDKNKQMDRSLVEEAKQVVEEVCRTKQPPFGSWN